MAKVGLLSGESGAELVRLIRAGRIHAVSPVSIASQSEQGTYLQLKRAPQTPPPPTGCLCDPHAIASSYSAACTEGIVVTATITAVTEGETCFHVTISGQDRDGYMVAGMDYFGTVPSNGSSADGGWWQMGVDFTSSPRPSLGVVNGMAKLAGTGAGSDCSPDGQYIGFGEDGTEINVIVS